MSLIEANPGNRATLATYRNDNTLGANLNIAMVTMLNTIPAANQLQVKPQERWPRS